MQYKDFVLDQFQVDAIESINKNNSVVVSAATGTGKTLIADYIIDKAIQEGKKVFYTAPIKALSNQKFKDFKEEYGENKVGLLTGDIVINSEAEIVIMTTEIYRNMLMVNDPIVNDVSYIVFDEIHFINDIERGTVWEESIIFSPEHMRFLCLSATIPNARQFADWIESIQSHTVDVVEYAKRAVPLNHFVFEAKMGLTKASKLKKNMELDDYPDYAYVKGKRKKRKDFGKPATHIDVVKEIKKNGTPTIFFTFSRKACEVKGKELAKRFDLTDSQEKKRIAQVFSENLNDETRPMQSTGRLREVITRGVAFHHAGMLPKLKEIVEILFGEGLVKVLYATETFAVGINMPAKTVCFNTVQKYDGISFRYLNTKEYFQMAGRAGRRGIDKEGKAIVLVNRGMDDINKIIKLTTKDVEPIQSQFKLSINTVLNLINNYDEEEIETILKSNFDYFQRKQGNKQVRIMASWKNKLKLLNRMGYVKDNELTWKGWFARFIYANEILVSEVFATDIYQQLSQKELVLTVAAIAYEPKRGNRFYQTRKTQDLANKLIKKLFTNKYLAKQINPRQVKNLAPIINDWMDGCEFADLLTLSNLEEGDYIRIFRQVIDYMRQIKKGTKDEELIDRINYSLDKIDRDVIKVEF
ncbi:MAG: DEAD/DEAH box helicase [Candidatus Woesearchaeota archaeon]